MLALIQEGDATASYRLLGEQGRAEYASAAEWERRVGGLAPVTAFEVERVDGSEVVALVSHQPGLDPFQGLVPGQERQTWSVEAVAGGWLVVALPASEPVLPDDAAARDAAVAWVQDVQRCDEEAARARQAVEILFGTSATAPVVCDAAGAVAAGPVARLQAGPASADIVAQYTSDALVWARTVPITIGDLRLTLIMAPVGDSWEVLGVSD